MTPGNVHAVAPVTTATSRVGNAYILRGWIGIFSTGVDRLGVEIKNTGVNAEVFQDDQWSALADNIRKNFKNKLNPEPLVLIGHSYGADDIVRIARELDKDHISVDLLLTLDPVTPPEVPGNVKRCINLYQTNGAWDKLPFLRGVRLDPEPGTNVAIANENIRVDRTDLLEPGLDHFNIEKKQKIHEEIIKQVLATCPPRNEWAMMHAVPTNVASANVASANSTSANGGSNTLAIPASATVRPTYNTSDGSTKPPARSQKPASNSRASANDSHNLPVASGSSN